MRCGRLQGSMLLWYEHRPTYQYRFGEDQEIIDHREEVWENGMLFFNVAGQECPFAARWTPDRVLEGRCTASVGLNGTEQSAAAVAREQAVAKEQSAQAVAEQDV